MAEDDDIPQEDEGPLTLYGTPEWKEAREVCEDAHHWLLGDAVGGEGKPQGERVDLTIPEGLLLVARYVTAREVFKEDRDWMEEAQKDKGQEGKAFRSQVHEFLTKCLKDALHAELHDLATGNHRIFNDV
jgi:hypothetical protein